MIDRMVLIDAVVMGRQLQSRYAKNHDSLPQNVISAINLYATEDAYGIISPFDAGLQYIEGALNIGMVGTNHCSIASSSCSPKFTNPYVPSQFSVPLRQNETGPINTQTLNWIKHYLNPPSY